MADSITTKRAMATALKTLLTEQSFSKISIGAICDECKMNRKSFYYHFKDKYDLVNWIFDDEITELITKSESKDIWTGFLLLCNYFYENRAYYRKVLKIEGQNSFYDHFREICANSFLSQVTDKTHEKSIVFQINLMSDILISAIKRWLLEKDCMSAEEFVSLLEHFATTSAKRILEHSNE